MGLIGTFQGNGWNEDNGYSFYASEAARCASKERNEAGPIAPTVCIYFTGILITIAPMTSLILKSRLGLSG